MKKGLSCTRPCAEETRLSARFIWYPLLIKYLIPIYRDTTNVIHLNKREIAEQLFNHLRAAIICRPYIFWLDWTSWQILLLRLGAGPLLRPIDSLSTQPWPPLRDPTAFGPKSSHHITSLLVQWEVCRECRAFSWKVSKSRHVIFLQNLEAKPQDKAIIRKTSM